MNAKTFRELRKVGLRIEPPLDTRGKTVTIKFEAPAQICQSATRLYKNLSIGMYSFIRSGTLRNVKSIGRYCSIGPNVTLGEAEHPTNWLSTSPAQYLASQFKFYPPEIEAAKARVLKNDAVSGDVVIGNDVWIGGGVTIRRGVTIGDGAIVAGDAFVTKDVEPYSVVGGLPAKVIRMRFDADLASDLQELAWWQYDINQLKGVDFSDPSASIRAIDKLAKQGNISSKPPSFLSVQVSSSGYWDLQEE